jgi:hypothetical protein
MMETMAGKGEESERTAGCCASPERKENVSPGFPL